MPLLTVTIDDDEFALFSSAFGDSFSFSLGDGGGATLTVLHNGLCSARLGSARVTDRTICAVALVAI